MPRRSFDNPGGAAWRKGVSLKTVRERMIRHPLERVTVVKREDGASQYKRYEYEPGLTAMAVDRRQQR